MTKRQTKNRSNSASEIQQVNPVLNRPPNADESAPETLIPEIVRTSLHESSSDRTNQSAADLEARIARRAYELAMQRGFAPGEEMDDWLRAEKEIQSAPPRQASPEDQFTG